MKRWTGLVAAAALTAALLWGGVATAHALEVSPQVQQQMFQAVQQYLMASRLPARDLPKRLIEVKELGDRRYQVHLEMGQGEGWFEVSWDRDHWAVKGINRPQ